MRLVLQLFLDHQLLARKDKCEFFKEHVEYLGFLVSKEDIAADRGKVEVILSWPEPTTVQQMQQFLGLSVHLKGFIDDYARIAAPLTDLTLKKAKFLMNDEARRTFE